MTARTLRSGIGVSEAPDATEAGRLAAAAALERLHGEQPALILVYTSVRYDLPTLLASIRAVTGDTPLVGATSSGQIHDGGLMAPGAGVAVLALTAGPYRFGTAMVEGLTADSEAAGRALARLTREAAGPDLPPHAALLLLTDGLAGDQQQIVNGVYRVTGAAVPVVGGAAGDDFRLQQTSVLYDDRVLEDAAVGVWIASERPLSVVTRHGWNPISLPMLVTQTEGHQVLEIAGRSALEVYREHADLRPLEEIRAASPGEYVPELATHALGLIEPDGSQLIRAVMIDQDNHLRSFAPLPPYAAVQVVSCYPDDILDAGNEVAACALGDREASVLLAFSCIARLGILGERAPEEAIRLQAAAGGVSTFGFYTYGEFARTTSIAGFHNASVTAIAL